MKLEKIQRRKTRPIAAPIEFTDAKGIEKLFTVRQTKLHELRHLGLIKSFVIRTKGRRGKRLYDVNSVRTLLLASEDNTK
jgi:hypothetical protein